MVADVLDDDVNVVLEDRGDGNDGRLIGHSASDELANLVVLLQCLVLLDEVHLVLKDDDVTEAHDLYGSKVLRGLRLRARFVACVLGCGRDEQSR